MTTEYKSSDGRTFMIEKMNAYHLHNAIKKLSANYKRSKEAGETLAALRTEQERRGGPPEDAK